jgi:hypothetical protein
MRSLRSEDEEVRQRTSLLREVVELLMWELSAISDRKWEELPDLKRKKNLLADRLKQFDWTPGPGSDESLELIMLKSQIADLEYQSRQKLRVQLQMIRGQINALNDKRQSWLECLNIYCGRIEKPTSAL